MVDLGLVGAGDEERDRLGEAEGNGDAGDGGSVEILKSGEKAGEKGEKAGENGEYWPMS